MAEYVAGLEKAQLSRDAFNRALRTLWQNVGIDVVVAVVILLQPVITNTDNWAAIDWRLLGFSVAKTVVLTVFAYVMRRFLDKSKVPTPLPPAPVAEPNEDVPEVPDEGDGADPLGRG